MIAKVSIIVLLAAVASGASLCCEPQQVVPSCGVVGVSSGISGLDSGISGISGISGVSGLSGVSGIADVSGLSVGGPVTRNLVAKGKYPVALANNGPNADSRVPVTTSQVTAPCQEKLVRLPCSIPQPKVVSHCCTCYKTIVRPRVHQQIITVPTVQRYIQTTHKPVVENIQYEAVPVNCNSNSGLGVELSSGISGVSGVVSSGSVIPSVSSCAPVVETVAPVVQSVAPVQTIVASAPVTQALPALPSFEIPQVQTVAAPASISFGSSSCAC